MIFAKGIRRFDILFVNSVYINCTSRIVFVVNKYLDFICYSRPFENQETERLP